MKKDGLNLDQPDIPPASNPTMPHTCRQRFHPPFVFRRPSGIFIRSGAVDVLIDSRRRLSWSSPAPPLSSFHSKWLARLLAKWQCGKLAGQVATKPATWQQQTTFHIYSGWTGLDQTTTTIQIAITAIATVTTTTTTTAKKDISTSV